jgi:iron complex transport system permease protein
MGAADPVAEAVLLSIRLPRALLAILVGAALAVAGAAMQGLFRNPLADPGLIGVSTGAALVAALVIVLGSSLPLAFSGLLRDALLPLAAFLGGLGATWLVYRIASREGRTEVATMLLAGIALNAVAGAGIGLLIFASDDQALRDLNFWLLGSLGGVTWDRLLIAAPAMLAPALAALWLARPLNALLFGETEALHLGFAVERVKRLVVVLSALAVGASVALTGVIGFVGLVVPHLVRLTLGPDHRVLLPASLMLGATLLLLADLLARTLVLPAELPIGILTSCVGGPFFLWLLLRRRGLGLW